MQILGPIYESLIRDFIIAWDIPWEWIDREKNPKNSNQGYDNDENYHEVQLSGAHREMSRVIHRAAHCVYGIKPSCHQVTYPASLENIVQPRLWAKAAIKFCTISPRCSNSTISKQEGILPLRSVEKLDKIYFCPDCNVVMLFLEDVESHKTDTSHGDFEILPFE